MVPPGPVSWIDTDVSAGLPETVPERVNVVGDAGCTGATFCGATAGACSTAAGGVVSGAGAGAGAGATVVSGAGATVVGTVVTWLTGVDTDVSVPELAASTRLVPPGPVPPPP